MSNQITKDQHYVPRSYLKNFATVIGTGKKEKAFVSFYQFDGAILKEDIPTKSICYKSYFYGEDGEIEKDFSIREAKWATVLRDIMIMKSYELTSEQEELIKEFAVYQFCRTMATHNFVKASAEELLTVHITKSFHFDPGDEIVRNMVKEKVEDEITPSLLIENCNDLVFELDDLGIAVIRFNTRESLITSDMPVLALNPFGVSGVGMAMVGVFIIIPIAPHVAVAIYDKKVYLKCRPYMEIANDNDVINLNKYQIVNAEERIIALTANDLQIASGYADALEQRDKLQRLQKVDSSYDGFGTFFAIHTRRIPYVFDLSFCALPRIIKKVPKECRDLFPRTYSKENWHKLLIQQYRIPDLLKKEHEVDSQTVEERKKGYSNLRGYLEDYWEIPCEERIITPEMMRKIKTCSTTFFPIARKNNLHIPP